MCDAQDFRRENPRSDMQNVDLGAARSRATASKLPGVTAEPRPEPLRDAERTRADLIEVATAVFAEQGYSGARVDEIAERTRTTKRMIYYYFGGKEQLYLAVLENAYRGHPRGRTTSAGRPCRSGGRHPGAGRDDLRPSHRPSRLHSAGRDREHSSRRVHRPPGVAALCGPAGDFAAGPHSRAGAASRTSCATTWMPSMCTS